eukprot:Sspe_Gene.69053::Locus_40694_Transcript_4_4_Confidence_0.429_Length_2555::g.69053::m.69053
MQAVVEACEDASTSSSTCGDVDGVGVEWLDAAMSPSNDGLGQLEFPGALRLPPQPVLWDAVAVQKQVEVAENLRRQLGDVQRRHRRSLLRHRSRLRAILDIAVKGAHRQTKRVWSVEVDAALQQEIRHAAQRAKEPVAPEVAQCCDGDGHQSPTTPEMPQQHPTPSPPLTPVSTASIPPLPIPRKRKGSFPQHTNGQLKKVSEWSHEELSKWMTSHKELHPYTKYFTACPGGTAMCLSTREVHDSYHVPYRLALLFTQELSRISAAISSASTSHAKCNRMRALATPRTQPALASVRSQADLEYAKESLASELAAWKTRFVRCHNREPSKKEYLGSEVRGALLQYKEVSATLTGMEPSSSSRSVAEPLLSSSPSHSLSLGHSAEFTAGQSTSDGLGGQWDLATHSDTSPVWYSPVGETPFETPSSSPGGTRSSRCSSRASTLTDTESNQITSLLEERAALAVELAAVGTELRAKDWWVAHIAEELERRKAACEELDDLRRVHRDCARSVKGLQASLEAEVARREELEASLEKCKQASSKADEEGEELLRRCKEAYDERLLAVKTSRQLAQELQNKEKALALLQDELSRLREQAVGDPSEGDDTVPYVAPSRFGLGIGSPVVLNVYDMPDSGLQRLGPIIGLGTYHTGLAVYGREYSFMSSRSSPTSPTGVYWTQPMKSCQGLKETIRLGETRRTQMQVHRLVASLSKEWDHTSYHLLTRNCNHFTECLARKLLPTVVLPSYINRAASVGSTVIPDVVFNALTGSPRKALE